MHNVAVIKSSCLNQERNMNTVYNWKQSKTNMWVDFDVKGQQEMDFSLKEVLLWIIARSEGLKINTLQMDLFVLLQTCSFLLLKTLTDGLEWCGLLWCFYQLFGLSFWRHPFTAEHPLVIKWFHARFLQIYSDEETHLRLGWSEDEHIFIFGWTIPVSGIPAFFFSRVHLGFDGFPEQHLGWEHFPVCWKNKPGINTVHNNPHE